MDCLGIPVHYEPDFESVSVKLVTPAKRWHWLWHALWPWRFVKFTGLVETRGWFGSQYIVVGRAFFAFPKREQQAILLHEVGHVKLNHIGKRLLKIWQIILAPFAFARLCVAQEFQADYFAAECGYALELASALSRMRTDTRASLHPAVSERVARLAAWPLRFDPV